jgi:AraC-like DNA-binding protein
MQKTEEFNVAALVGNAECRERIRLNLDGHATVSFVSTNSELLSALAYGGFAAVLIEPEDADGVRTDHTVREIRRRFAHLPILVYAGNTPDSLRRVFALAQAGADEVILRGFDDAGVMFRRTLRMATEKRKCDDVLSVLGPHAPSYVQPILVYALANAGQSMTVDDMAQAVGVHRRTLVNRLRTAGFPPPSALVSWCRLIKVGRLLEDDGRSVEQAASTLGFGSATALRNMLRHHTGMAPGEVRRGGGQAFIVSILLNRIETTRSSQMDALEERRGCDDVAVNPAAAQGLEREQPEHVGGRLGWRID